MQKSKGRPEAGNSENHYDSLHPLRQIFRPQMRVPRQHLKRLVARDGSDLHRIKTLLKKPTCGFVPEIVKMKSMWSHDEMGRGKMPFLS